MVEDNYTHISLRKTKVQVRGSLTLIVTIGYLLIHSFNQKNYIEHDVPGTVLDTGELFWKKREQRREIEIGGPVFCDKLP